MSNYKKYGDIIKETTTEGSDSSGVNKNSNVIEITSQNDKLQLIQNNDFVVVDVYGKDCQPCRAIAPQFEKLSRKEGNYGFVVFAKEDYMNKITTDIRGVPTFQYFYKGKMIHPTTVGADIPEVAKRIEDLKRMAHV